MTAIEKTDLKYIARDKNGQIWAFKSKPIKSEINEVWMSNDWHIRIDDKLYPDVKWEDKDPTKLGGGENE